jgi:2,4-dienoyl-CoA reductase-like NADH-dependent reductase (Old Yellow Enzyme family)
MSAPVPAPEAPIEVLARPLPLRCGASLPNRIAKAAMSEQLGESDAAPTDRLVQLYRRWAGSGAGLLLSGNVMVDPKAIAEPGNVAVEDGRHLPILRRWAEAGQSRGAQLWMQINHPGRQSPRSLSKQPVAPSAVGIKVAGQFAVPRALTSPEIQEIVERFGRTAAVAREAGFSGAQIHGAHGYLVSQFLSPRANLRDDEWGGDPVRRRRFLLEVLRSVRRHAGADFPLGVKLNSADFQRGGFTEEECEAVLESLEAEGVDLVELSGGTYEAAAMVMGRPDVRESTRRREAYFVEFAERARTRTPVPLMVTGGFRTAAGMVDAVSSRAVDVVGLARPMALEPDLPGQLLAGHAAASTAQRRRMGVRLFDAVAEQYWYVHQIHRMADGLEPDPRRGNWASVVTGFYRTITGSRPRRNAPAAGQG